MKWKKKECPSLQAAYSYLETMRSVMDRPEYIILSNCNGTFFDIIKEMLYKPIIYWEDEGILQGDILKQQYFQRFLKEIKKTAITV